MRRLGGFLLVAIGCGFFMAFVSPMLATSAKSVKTSTVSLPTDVRAAFIAGGDCPGASSPDYSSAPLAAVSDEYVCVVNRGTRVAGIGMSFLNAGAASDLVEHFAGARFGRTRACDGSNSVFVSDAVDLDVDQGLQAGETCRARLHVTGGADWDVVFNRL